MGWIAVYKNGTIEREGGTKQIIGEDGNPKIEGVGRPVQAGENGELVCVAQEDFGHTVAVDLTRGLIAIDYEAPLDAQNGTLEVKNPKLVFAICEETNIIGELKNIETHFEPWFNCGKTKWIDVEDTNDAPQRIVKTRRQVACEDGSTKGDERCENNHKRKPVLHDDGTPVTVRTDILHDLVWRPIWFTRYTNGIPTKVIGAQTTTPEAEGARNVKKLVMIYDTGMIGID